MFVPGFFQVVSSVINICGPGPPLAHDCSAQALSDRLQHLDGIILGLAVLRQKSSPTTLTLLTGSERFVFDYWLVSPHHDKPLVIVDVVRAQPCLESQSMQSQSGQVGKHYLFSDMTKFSLDRIMAVGPAANAQDASLVSFDQYLELWSVRNISAVVVMMPLPHALLCIHGVWDTWGFPYLQGAQRRGQPYEFGRQLWAELEVGEAIDANVGQDAPPPVRCSPLGTIINSCRHAHLNQPSTWSLVIHDCPRIILGDPGLHPK